MFAVFILCNLIKWRRMFPYELVGNHCSFDSIAKLMLREKYILYKSDNLPGEPPQKKDNKMIFLSDFSSS